jgi:hypothetical protein
MIDLGNLPFNDNTPIWDVRKLDGGSGNPNQKDSLDKGPAQLAQTGLLHSDRIYSAAKENS